MTNRAIIQTGRLVAALLLCSAAQTRAEPPAADRTPGGPAPILGLSTDILPLAISAAAGELGGTLAVGIAYQRLQVRALAFRVAIPEFAHGAPAFDRVGSIGGGLIADYFFGDDLSGPWIGAGLEVSSVSARHGATQVTTRSTVFAPTASFGWQFRFGRGFFVGPHAGFVYALNPAKAAVGSDRLDQAAFTPEISIKLGWYFSL